ncbi:MAG TPA: DedA family protein [Candidatus Bathyarchaeia archaeon]|nr:DedA family protein [Candidatus Bathyarchaeia archaeon]
MINSIITFLVHWITNSISKIGYPAIFVLMFLESALVPIPSEVTMPFAGFLAAKGFFNFWLVILTGSLANLGGSLAAYALGFWGQAKLVKKLVNNFGKYLLIDYGEIEKAERWFRKRGELIAFTSRLLPVVRTFISLPAGFSQMNVLRFSVYSFFGSLIWSTVLAYLGLVLGENWAVLEVYFRKFQLVILLFLSGLVFIYVRHKLKKIRSKKSS